MELLQYLRDLRDSVCQPYIQFPQTKAVFSIGSLSYGVVDHYSDIDIAIYYEELPSPEQLEAAMRANGVEKLNWAAADRENGELMESYSVRGVECQFAHSTIERWEHYMDSVLVSHEIDSPIQKALSGTLAGVPLYGEDVIERFKARARAYPPELGKAMVEKYLNFTPLWALEERLRARDAFLWKQQALVEGAYNVLGVLAGLNQLYFTTFQFKGMRLFIDSMTLKPPDLANRIESMFKYLDQAIPVFQSLVAETVALVEMHMPDVDTNTARTRLARMPEKWAVVT